MRNGECIICSECERLWSHYERASHQHRTLLAKLKAAPGSVDKAGAALLIQQINAADLALRKAKESLETIKSPVGIIDMTNLQEPGVRLDAASRVSVNMFPMLGSTLAMVHQLSADLYDCLECSWMLVATCIGGKPAALFIFGAPPDRDCESSIGGAHLVRPIELERAPGALALGPKTTGAAYLREEIELIEEFAAHIAKILMKEARIRSFSFAPA